VFPIDAEGRLGATTTSVRQRGVGVHGITHQRSFPHAMFPDPTGQRVLCCDMGLDRVMIYDVDPGTPALQAARQPVAHVSTGAGPRHLAGQPDGRRVYVLNQMDSTISVFGYDAESGAMGIVQTVSTLPDGVTGTHYASHIVVHPNGRFVYSGN